MAKLRSNDDAVRRMVERGAEPDFTDPATEWRRVFAEVWGTFLLVAAAMGGAIGAEVSPDKITYGMAVVAPGLTVMAVIYTLAMSPAPTSTRPSPWPSR